MCNEVVDAKPSSEVMASRDELPSFPVVIPAHSMLETALALLISLKTSLEQESWKLMYKYFLAKYRNNLNSL